MQMRVNVLAPTILVVLVKRWKALSLTVWAMVRHVYRATITSAFKDVLVVKGKDNPTSEFDLLEVVEITPAEQVTYDPNHPMFAGGNLGQCNAG